MKLTAYFRLALRALAGNKLRTGLTMLGIIIGVGVVILVVAIGQGATKQVTDAVNSLGTNILSIRPGQNRVRMSAVSKTAGSVAGSAASANHLTLTDTRLLKKSFPQTIAAVAPQARGNVQIQMGNMYASTSAMGVTVDYLPVNNVTLSNGSFFTEQDDEGGRKVCVVGPTVAAKMGHSPSDDLTGQTIAINHQTFQILGMLTPKGAGAFGQDQDDVILLPIQTAMRRLLNKTYVDFLSVQCTSEDMMPLAQQQIASFLRNRHHLPPPYPANDDFQIMSQTELMQRQQTVADTMTSLLTAVAVISLVVGGIGIMNIMLVSVTERTREIGIRKAIGANPRDILLQFLMESAIISIIGGVMGVVLGVGSSEALSRFGHWNTIVSIPALILALVVSAGVGIFFGIYPASKASAMRPIDALRYE